MREGEFRIREIDEVLDAVGWPTDMRSVFTGDLTVSSFAYVPGAELGSLLKERLREEGE